MAFELVVRRGTCGLRNVRVDNPKKWLICWTESLSLLRYASFWRYIECKLANRLATVSEDLSCFTGTHERGNLVQLAACCELPPPTYDKCQLYQI